MAQYQITPSVLSTSVALTSWEDDTPAEVKRELTQAQKDDQAQAHWVSLNSAYRENLGFDKDSRQTETLRKAIAQMVAEGFVYVPKVEPVKAKVIAPPIKEFTPATLRELYGVAEKVPCEVCGSLELPNVASHSLDNGDVCIRDAEIVRKSGRFPSWRLKELVELAVTTKANRLKQ
jgi:hypothetical protein